MPSIPICNYLASSSSLCFGPSFLVSSTDSPPPHSIILKQQPFAHDCPGPQVLGTRHGLAHGGALGHTAPTPKHWPPQQVPAQHLPAHRLSPGLQQMPPTRTVLAGQQNPRLVSQEPAGQQSPIDLSAQKEPPLQQVVPQETVFVGQH